MDSKIFWGIIIIFIGFSIVFNHLFKFNFPFFRIIIALVIIFFGVKLLMGSFKKSNYKDGEHHSVFSDNKISPTFLDKDTEYNTVFGSNVVDLRNTEFKKNDLEMEVNAIFGSTKIYVPNNVKVRVKSTGVFGSVKTPSGGSSGFGDDKSSFGDPASTVTLNIEANAVFGSVEIR